jgi:hypothetical protein
VQQSLEVTMDGMTAAAKTSFHPMCGKQIFSQMLADVVDEAAVNAILNNCIASFNGFPHIA